ncbi:MAG TPA: ATP-binding protein [Candidatus Nanoarchaeia archaeon]|nr:ATP-binding protein [Candidatus Nanoarchaeia archaeon]
MTKGQVISGQFGKILVRQKAGENLELGELLIAENEDSKILLQVFDLLYGSQISQQNLELISGLDLESSSQFEFMDPKLRNYTLAVLKSLVNISKDSARIAKSLPAFFSTVREITKDDIKFLTKPKNPLFVGKLRSGSKTLDVDIFLPGDKVFAHHILIPATTGRGKSNLTSCMLWNTLDQDYCGILVLDPHDEYYGRDSIGLKDHPSRERLVYYTADDVPVGQRSLKISLELIKPSHFNGVVEWSTPQKEALNVYYKTYGNKWIEAVVLEKTIKGNFNEGTLAVIKRRILSLLDLEFDGQQLYCNGIFELNAGMSTINAICSDLENAKTVVIDTSGFEGAVEILVGSLIATEILANYKRYKAKNQLKSKPVISIIIEEAPRVLGKEVLEAGPNIFSTIAREGRKFKVGLTAITQLPSLIPRQILANINTKIILGIEMAPERQAIIESASQDLSEDARNIASLDVGEAILSSNFSAFALPIKIPLFEDLVKATPKKQKFETAFEGVG